MKTTLTFITWLLKPAYNLCISHRAIPLPKSFFRANLLFLLVTLYTTLSLLAQDAQNTTQVISGEQTQDIKDEYHFKGEFGADIGWSPFKCNEIKNIQLLEVPDSKTTFEDLLVHQEDWKWDDNLINIRPKKDKVYWIKTQLIGTNIFHGEQIFHVSQSGDDKFAFDYVDIYISKNKGDYTHQRTGNAVPLSERPYDFWATFFKVELQTADTLDLYIRLEGLNRYFPMEVIGLYHVDSSSVFTQQVHEAAKKWLIGGIFSIQFIVFLCLFFIERERIHFYFSTLILGILLILFFTDLNYFSYVPFPELNKYYPDILNLGLILAMIGHVKFTETYFNYPAASICSKRIIPIFVILCILVYLYVFFSTSFIFIVRYSPGLFLMLFSLVVPLWLAIRAEGQSKLLKKIWFIAVAPSSLLVGFDIVVNVLNLLGINTYDYKWLVLENFPFSMVFLFTVFSLSIGYRKNLLKKEKEKALEQNLKDQAIIIEKLEQTTKLEKMDEVKTRFFTNITHEFRTPLTVILGMTDQLGTGTWTDKMSVKEKDRHSNGLDLIDRNGKKLLQLINQLLDLSKIDSLNLKANYQLKEVVSFVQYVGESFESLAAKKVGEVTDL